MIQKPLKPFEIDPKAFILMVESFIKSYPQHSLELKEIAEKGELELDKLDYFSEKGINFNEIAVLNEKNGKPFLKLEGQTKQTVKKKFKKKTIISLSISDEKKYAVAFVTISL